jgi:malonyl-CoA O-methyltransferase
MQLHSTRLPALSNRSSAPELVLLHGWGTSSVIWDEWLPLLRRDCHVTLIDLPGYGDSAAVNSIECSIELTPLLAAIVDSAPPTAVYLGYSLGGMLAVNIASQYPERVLALVTLATNVRFVASPSWPWAMQSDTFQAFSTALENDAPRALKRFSGLQASGAEDEKTLLKTLRAKTGDCSSEALQASLQLLAEIDNIAIMAELACPCLQLFADRDSLVPVAAAEQLEAAGSSTVVVLDKAPHSFFISQPEPSWSAVTAFLQQQQLLVADSAACKPPRVLDKQQVARSFSRAAASYDSVAELQRRVGEKLITQLPTQLPTYLPETAAEVVLDLGCGTGYFSSQLQAAFPDSAVVGLDMAEGMLTYAAGHQANRHWLCADAERLPLADQSVEVIFSSLAIQWCEDYPALFAEAHRVLKPGGSLVFSTLGPNTLHELRSAWLAVDDYVHVNRFVERGVLAEAVRGSGFTAELVLQEEVITLEYPSLKDLTRELKGLGAHNVNSGRPSGLTGKRRLQQLIEGYERQRNSRQLLPASYQVWYGCLQKPLYSHLSQKPELKT